MKGIYMATGVSIAGLDRVLNMLEKLNDNIEKTSKNVEKNMKAFESHAKKSEKHFAKMREHAKRMSMAIKLGALALAGMATKKLFDSLAEFGSNVRKFAALRNKSNRSKDETLNRKLEHIGIGQGLDVNRLSEIRQRALRAGTDEQQFLSQLGINAQEFSNLDQQQALVALLERFKSVGDVHRNLIGEQLNLTYEDLNALSSKENLGILKSKDNYGAPSEASFQKYNNASNKIERSKQHLEKKFVDALSNSADKIAGAFDKMAKSDAVNKLVNLAVKGIEMASDIDWSKVIDKIINILETIANLIMVIWNSIKVIVGYIKLGVSYLKEFYYKLNEMFTKMMLGIYEAINGIWSNKHTTNKIIQLKEELNGDDSIKKKIETENKYRESVNRDLNTDLGSVVSYGKQAASSFGKVIGVNINLNDKGSAKDMANSVTATVGG